MSAAMLGGCGGRAGTGSSAGIDDSATPLNRLRRSGLDVRAYVLTNEDHAVERSLEALRREGVARDDPAFQSWRDNGVRVISVPVSSLDALDGLWASRGISQRTRMGETPTWASVHAGPGFRETTVGTDTGLLTLDAGRLHIMARVWTTPRRSWEDDRPGVRLDVVPRYQTSDTVSDDLDGALQRFAQSVGASLSSAGGGAGRADEDARTGGLWFRRMLVEQTHSGERALVFISDHPLADWSALSDEPVRRLTERRITLRPFELADEDASDRDPARYTDGELVAGNDEGAFSADPLPSSEAMTPTSPGLSLEGAAGTDGRQATRRETIGSLLLPRSSERFIAPVAEEQAPEARGIDAGASEPALAADAESADIVEATGKEGSTQAQAESAADNEPGTITVIVLMPRFDPERR